MPTDEFDIAVAHEHYPCRGGGEVVADELADAFNAPIVTGWITDSEHSEHDPIEILENTPVRWLRRWMGNPLVRDLFYAFAWETVPTLREYDVVIQSGNAPSWYVPEEEQVVIKYNHTPPRSPYDLFHRESTAGPLDIINPLYIINRLYLKSARQVWKNRTSEIDLWVCNSEVVARRTERYLGVDRDRIRVVYPPVDVDAYTPTAGGDYYVVVSRMEPAKQIGTIIDAFHELNAEAGTYPLAIVGDGPLRGDLEARADGAPYIEFEGYVPEARKRELLQDAKASIFAAKNEDFGMVTVESMAAGTPVLGVDEGFTRHQLRDGVNGILFERGPANVRRAVEEFEQSGIEWNATRLHRYARQFSRERFVSEMEAAIEEAIERAQVDPAVEFPKREPLEEVGVES